MVVHSNATYIPSLQNALQGLKYDVSETDTGKQALDLLLDPSEENKSFDAIFVDINLSELTAQSFGRLIKAREELREIPLILIEDGSFVIEEVNKLILFGSSIHPPFNRSRIVASLMEARKQAVELVEA